MTELSRRQFIRLAGAAVIGTALFQPGCTAPPAQSTGRLAPPAPTGAMAWLAVAHGADPAAITKAALSAVGGIERFVKRGNDVIIKPNICVDYHPAEYAATTNPVVVGTLVALCLGAGAKRVRVMDTPLGGTPDAAYAISGIGDAVRAAGGIMEVMSPAKFAKSAIPQGKDLTEWDVYQDVLQADVLINVPIAKQHSLARLSLGCKNLLGTVATPNMIHRNLGQRIADLTSLIRPSLTVVDAVRILTAHGPTGGSLNDVKQTNTIIVSHDIVSADAYAATLFNLTGADIPYLQAAADMGLGKLKLDSIKISELNV